MAKLEELRLLRERVHDIFMITVVSEAQFGDVMFSDVVQSQRKPQRNYSVYFCY